MTYEIVILAMIAAFLGMRLYSVLGKRAEGEEEFTSRHFEPRQPERAGNDAPEAPERRTASIPAPQRKPDLQSAVPAVERGVNEIAAADRNFDLITFMEGARGAYAMVLEAFWRGDREALRELCDDDVYASFAAAIDAREAAGETLDNKLIRIEDSKVHSAMMDGRVARIAVLFVADIAAVTRNAEGQVIAGSLDDAVESRDIWTFSRDVTAAGPDWILDETDEG